MYAAVRRYEGITDDAEAGRLVRESFLPLLDKVQGFIAYYWIDAGDGAMASLSVFDDKAGADESVSTGAPMGSGQRRRAHPARAASHGRLGGRERNEVARAERSQLLTGQPLTSND